MCAKQTRRHVLGSASAALVSGLAGIRMQDRAQAATNEQSFEVDDPSLDIDVASVPNDAASRTYPTLGSVDAPNEVMFYGGWKCPYTRNFVTNLLPTIVQRFVVSGDLRIVFQPVVYKNGEPFHGFDEVQVARAGFAIWKHDPETFWTFFEYFYANQVTQAGWYSPERVLKIARAANATEETPLRKAMKSKQYVDRITATMKRVRSIPILAVPRLVLDGEVYAPTVREDKTMQALAETRERKAQSFIFDH